MIKDIAASLLAKGGLGVPGRSLFIYHVPDEINKCLLIIDDLEGIVRNEELPGYKKAHFKIIVRDTEYQSGVTIARQVISALDLHRLTVNGIYLQRMRATHDPIAFPIPDSDVIEISVNMQAVFVEP